MKLALPIAIVIAAIAWIVLYVIIGIPLWIAFVVAGGIVALALAGGSVQRTSS